MILRKEAIISRNFFYNPDYLHTEDYELWVRLADRFILSNIDEVLLYYRIHSHQVSNVNTRIQEQMADKIRKKQLAKLNIGPTEEQLQIHKNLYKGSKFNTKEERSNTNDWIRLLIEQNRKVGYYSHRVLQNMLHQFYQVKIM